MARITTADMRKVVLWSFAGSAKTDALSAIDMLNDYPVFTDTDWTVIYRTICEYVYSKQCPSTIDEWTLLMHLEACINDAGNRSKFTELRLAIDKHEQYQGQPREAASLLIALEKKHAAIAALKECAATLNWTENVEEKLSETADTISKLAIGYRPPLTRDEIIEQTMREIEAVRRGDEEYGLELGVAPPAEGASILKRHVALKPGKLYVLGGLKKTGKTKLLTYILLKQAMADIPTSFVSLEMSDRQVIRWTLGALTQINTGRIPSRSLTDYEMNLLNDGAEVLKRKPFDVYYHPGANASVIRHHLNRCRALNPDGRIVVGIDHLHLMDHRQSRSESEVSAISRSVTDVLHATQETDAITILLGQLSNEAERAKHPSIMHLKGAGAIGECAEGVWMLKNWARGGNDKAKDEDGKVKLTMGITQRDGESGITAKMMGDMAIGHFYEVAA